MNDLRNVLIHNYEGADAEIVWGITRLEIPQVLESVIKMLDESDGGATEPPTPA